MLLLHLYTQNVPENAKKMLLNLICICPVIGNILCLLTATACMNILETHGMNAAAHMYVTPNVLTETRRR